MFGVGAKNRKVLVTALTPLFTLFLLVHKCFFFFFHFIVISDWTTFVNKNCAHFYVRLYFQSVSFQAFGRL